MDGIFQINELLEVELNTKEQTGKELAFILITITLILLAVVSDIPTIGLASPGQQNIFSSFPLPPSLLSPSPLLSKIGLAKGKFLVARKQLRDPNFSETVVLLLEYDRNGALGLVINQPTEVKLSTVFPDIKGLQQRTDTVFIGGPVARRQLLLLIRTDNQPEESRHVFDDIYVSTSRVLLQRMIEKANAREKFRVYAGYAGWAPGQLDREVSRGDWHILQADAETVFDKAPSEIWPELIRRSSVQWVRVQ
jgi:putative transcriptional regulator